MPIITNARITVRITFCKVLACIFETLGAEDQALLLINKAVERSPLRPDLRLLATRLCLKRGRVEQAIFHWGKAVGKQGRASLLYWLRRRNNYFFTDHYVNKGILEDNIEETPKNEAPATSPCDEGIRLLKIDRVKEALAVFKKIEAMDGTDPSLSFNIGLTLSKLGKHQEAIRYYERAQAGGLNSVELLNNKGFSLSFMKNFEEAAACYELAKEMSAGDGIILTNLAACYQKMKLHNKALACYENAIQCDRADAETYNNYALCLDEMGRHKEALELYKRALEMKPHSKKVMQNMAICFSMFGCYQESLKILDGILSFDPDCYETWGLKGNLLNKIGQTQESTVCLKRALGL